MAVEHTRVSVGTSATAVYAHPKASDSSSGDFTQKYVTLTCVADYVVGGAGVTAATGFRIAAGGAFSVALEPGETLYAVVASGSQTVDVIANGR